MSEVQQPREISSLTQLEVGQRYYFLNIPDLEFEVTNIHRRETAPEDQEPDEEDDVEGRISIKLVMSGDTYDIEADELFGFLAPKSRGTLLRIDTKASARRNCWHFEDEREKRIRDQAIRDLKDHTLSILHETDAFQQYRYSRNNSSVYYFDVIFFPGSMLVQGDMGEFWWQRTRNMEGWARGSIDSLSYFAEKVIREIDTKDYEPEYAELWVDEEYERKVGQLIFEDRIKDGELSGELAALEETRDDLRGAAGESKEEFYRRLYHDSDWSDGCDLPSVELYSHHFLWVREGIRQVFKALDGIERKPAPALLDPPAKE